MSESDWLGALVSSAESMKPVLLSVKNRSLASWFTESVETVGGELEIEMITKITLRKRIVASAASIENAKPRSRDFVQGK